MPRSRILGALTATILVGGFPVISHGQSIRPCVTSAITLESLRTFAVLMVEDTSWNVQSFRTRFGMRASSAADVTVIRDDTICEAAAAGRDGWAARRNPRGVALVRIGTSSPLYLVGRPGFFGGVERGADDITLLGSRFQLLAGFLVDGGVSDGAPPPPPPPKPAGRCRTTDEATTAHLRFLRTHTGGSAIDDVSMRSQYTLPYVGETSQIVVVTDSTTCATALKKFVEVGLLADTTVTDVEVIRVDSNFVVSNPAIMAGDRTHRYLFDRAFKLIGGYFTTAPPTSAH